MRRKILNVVVFLMALTGYCLYSVEMYKQNRQSSIDGARHQSVCNQN